MKISCAYFTHPGKVRAINQDGLFLDGEIVKEGNFSEPVVIQRELRDGPALFVVVDGAGGHSAGEVACRTILSELRGSVERLGTIKSRTESDLTNEMVRIQCVLTSKANYETNLTGMAATLAGVAFGQWEGEDPPCGATAKQAAWFLSGSNALVFNCGDCRVYRMKDGALSKLTHDHSCVQQLCDEGKISEDEMRTHPQKNIVTAALKAGMISMNMYYRRCEAVSNDRFLICCDGVWEALSREDIENSVADDSLEAAARGLYDAVMKTGCGDNASFILLEINQPLVL
jgi:protein phosphatase